jgi:hypothetical protein
MFQATPMHLDLRCDPLRDVVCVDQYDLVTIVRFGKSVQFLKPTYLSPLAFKHGVAAKNSR